jgi:DNA polymerase
MAWTERQRSMLQAMGLRLWPAPSGDLNPLDQDQPERRLQPKTPQEQPLRPRPAVSAPLSPQLQRPETTVATAAAVATAEPGVPSRWAALDWSALRAEVAACRACALCEGRTQTVFGSGHEQAHWMIVGEAPGEQEDRQGQPFVGAAGQLLDRMLAALQLTRSTEGDQPPAQRVYIANTLKCRPPRNRNPEPAETAQCAPFLARQIELLSPHLILAMGRFAAQALLKTDEPIGRLRGRVHRSQGRPVVVTYHPAYLLRNPADKARAWEDLCLAAAQMTPAKSPAPPS